MECTYSLLLILSAQDEVKVGIDKYDKLEQARSSRPRSLGGAGRRSSRKCGVRASRMYEYGESEAEYTALRLVASTDEIGFSS